MNSIKQLPHLAAIRFRGVCARMCIPVCACTCVCVRTCVCMHTCACVCTYVCVCACVHALVFTGNSRH